MKIAKTIVWGTVLTLLTLVGVSHVSRIYAAFDTSSLKVLPTGTISVGVGDTFSAGVWFQTTNNSKVDGLQSEICYGNGISLSKVIVNSNAGFSSIPITVTKAGATKTCTTVVVISMSTASNLLASGKAFTLNFQGVSSGSGDISLNTTTSSMTGDNPASTVEKNITVNNVAGTSYNVAGTASAQIVDTWGKWLDIIKGWFSI